MSVAPLRRCVLRSRTVMMSSSSADQKLYVGKCADREGVRANQPKETRSKHLDWIVTSKRCVLAGPLLDSELTKPVYKRGWEQPLAGKTSSMARKDGAALIELHSSLRLLRC